ncbi:MAG: CPXCG motif-containing cysteine-rich protein [Ignavibacteriales bacterium]|nr:CPXCG motif-containing cysteine-rich protein [Ignavibacteriales bacterium]
MKRPAERRNEFTATYACAVCGEENEVFIELRNGNKQTLVEDCEICCRPNVLNILVIPAAGEGDEDSILIDVEFEG